MKIISRAALIVALSLNWGLSWGQDQTMHVSFGCPTTMSGAGDGSTYEIWLYNDGMPDTAAAKGWDVAQAFAASRDLRSDPSDPPNFGHLATFEDAAEEACVLAQAAAVATSPGVPLGENQQLWIGLVQNNGLTVPNSAEPKLLWGWVTAGVVDVLGPRGWEPGDMTTATSYNGWAGGTIEPNDASPGEDHGTIGRYGYDGSNPKQGWNDEEPTRGSLFGMVIEYDVAAAGEVVLECPAGDPCVIEFPSINPQLNTVTLPPGFGDGGSANVRSFLIQEDCSAVSPDPDGLGFRMVSFGVGGEADAIPVPDYLCAARWILASSRLSEDVVISEGVVEGRFNPVDFGLPSTGCAADNLPVPNPLKSDVLAYLPRSKQWGVPDVPPTGLGELPTTTYMRSNNHMQDYTIVECGSSRLRTKGNEFFGIGLNYYYPPPADVPTELRFRTISDLELMQEWAYDARMRNVIKQGDYSKMTQKIQGAITDIGQLEFLAARKKIQDLFKKFLAASKFKDPGPGEVNDFNWQGEGIARSSHILNMLDVYLIP